MIRDMLHRKNMKVLNKLLIATFVGLVVVSAPGFSKVKSGSNGPVKSTKKIEPDKSLSERDRLFVELREAAKNNDAARVNALVPKLEDHDLADYVIYFQLKPQLYDKGGQIKADASMDAAVEGFLRVHAGSAIADRLRNDWLLSLGKRKAWSVFDREYAQFVLDDDTQVKCYAMQSRLAKGEDAKKNRCGCEKCIIRSTVFWRSLP